MSSTQHTDVNGTKFTDADLEQWAADHESGYTGQHGPVVKGRPISVGHEAKPFTLRLDGARRAKLNHVAEARHTTPSQLMRDLIDSL